MNLRKPVNELSPSDIEQFPVWEFALDEEGDEQQDETTVRPVQLKEVVGPVEGVFIVKANFTLADGSTASGYLTPPSQSDNSLGTLQPAIVTTNGQVAFWCGAIEPAREEIDRYYSLLSKSAANIFPLQFESAVPVHGGEVVGTIPGFLVLEDWRTGKTKVVQ